MTSFILFSGSSEIMEALKELPVEHHNMELGGKTGVVVSTSNKDELDKELKNTLKGFKYLYIDLIGRTEYEGVYAVNISYGKKRRVVVETWDGTETGKVNFKKATEEILGAIIDEKIHIYVPHSSNVTEKEKDFNIFIWSSPVNKRSITCPEKMWGIKVDCRDSSFASSFRGTTIYDGDYQVAELIDNNLYIHHDVCHHGTENELNIYKMILTKVAEEFVRDPEEKERLLEERLRGNRNKYVSLCANRIKKEFDIIKADVAATEKRIGDYEKKIIEDIRRLQEKTCLLNSFDKELLGRREAYETEYDKLISMEKVIGVDVTDNAIEVFTKNLYCVDPRSKKLHDIGMFKITIPIGSGNLKWTNLTRRVSGHDDGMHAPHIFSSGKACLGNAQEVLPELIANYQFSIIAMYAIQFVESVNVEDAAGKHIDNWPVADKKKRK